MSQEKHLAPTSLSGLRLSTMTVEDAARKIYAFDFDEPPVGCGPGGPSPSSPSIGGIGPFEGGFSPIKNGEPGAAIANGISPRNLTEGELDFIDGLSDRSIYPDRTKIPVKVRFIALRLLITQLSVMFDSKHMASAVSSSAQICLETGFCAAFAGRFNFGGIKASPSAIKEWYAITGGSLHKNLDPSLPCRLSVTSEQNLSETDIYSYKNSQVYVNAEKSPTKVSRLISNPKTHDGHFEGIASNGRQYKYWKVYDFFRNNATLSAGLKDKVALLQNSRYGGCQVLKRTDLINACIKDKGYATDALYPQKLNDLISYYNKMAWYLAAGSQSLVEEFVRTSDKWFVNFDIFSPDTAAKETLMAEFSRASQGIYEPYTRDSHYQFI